MSEEKKSELVAAGSARFEVAGTILEYAKKDNMVMVSPCGLKMLAWTSEGVEEVEGYEELTLSEKGYILQMVVQMSEDVFNQYRRKITKEAATGGNAPKKGGLVVPSSTDRGMLATS